MLKVDLHVHTAEDPVDIISHDAFTLIDRAAALGFDALAITLHDRQLDRADVAAHAAERGIVLLRGVERTVDGKHVLLINFPSAAAGVRSFEEIGRLKRRHPAGLVIAPHPFFPGGSPLRSRLDAHAPLFDAVEWSYFWTRGLNGNRRAAAWAAAHRTPLVGNSDLHDLRQLGRTFSLVEAERDADAVCDAIRRGRVRVHTSPVPARELAAVLAGMALRGARRPVPAPDPSLLPG